MSLKKVNKTIGLLRKLQNWLPRTTLITIYRAFVRTHLDYVDILYDQAFNSSFHDRLESVQYNACLAITAAVRGASKEKFLESLRLRRWYRKLFLFYKYLKTNILNTFSIWFLLDVLHTQQGLCTNFPFLNQNVIFSKKNFSRLLSLNGIIRS